jgi:hypothetical protein
MGSVFLGREDGTDGIDGPVEPTRDFAIGRFEIDGARSNRVEFRREFRAVAAERLELRLEGVAVTIFLVPPVHGSLERIQC